ncbi:hypothetical protein COV13_02940 [Candidatus Woesearchaeota archaeon CG10_big_fil_rev_8_21_14_0_10_32_9]|nr:MAG: hypothetical protein COV13_02940 [Candidatus Woesearchaeota archaeon CG10_big_fil_rev_8_21_14_0_10_32_9]
MYEPQEDSHLLKEVVLKYCKSNKVGLFLDMGAGSGIQGFSVIDSVSSVLMVDVNQKVVNFLKEEIIKKGLADKIDVVFSDLFDSVPNRFKGKIDLAVFNPPYLPKGEDDYDDLELYGGEDGLVVTKKFLEKVRDFLSEEGVIFFVASSHSKIDKLEEFMYDKNFKFEIVAKEHIFFEDILIYKAF